MRTFLHGFESLASRNRIHKHAEKYFAVLSDFSVFETGLIWNVSHSPADYVAVFGHSLFTFRQQIRPKYIYIGQRPAPLAIIYFDKTTHIIISFGRWQHSQESTIRIGYALRCVAVIFTRI